MFWYKYSKKALKYLPETLVLHFVDLFPTSIMNLMKAFECTCVLIIFTDMIDR